MATEVGTAYVQIVPSAKGMVKAISSGLNGSDVKAAAREAGDSAGSKMGEGFGSSFKKFVVGGALVGVLKEAGSAIVGFGQDCINTGMEFDSSMSQIAATLGLTAEDIAGNVNGAGDTFDALRAKASEMGASTIYSASEAADGLNILAMSGYSAEDSIAMVEDVLHLAAAGSMDMASSAKYVAGSMKGFADSTKTSTYYADLMAKGATLANTSVAELGEAMSGGAATAAAYGQSAESMTISLLRLAEQGEVGSAASTALNAAMKDLYTGTDQAQAALKELGIAAYDESGAARDFNSVVDDLSMALSGMSDEEANAYKQTIFGIQGLNAYNAMTVTGVEKQQEWAEALAGASDGMGEAAKQYDTMTDNLQGDIAGWESAFSAFQIAISDKVTPALREFVQLGTERLSGLTAAFQDGGLSGAAAYAGGVLSEMFANVAGGIEEALPQVQQFFSDLPGNAGEWIGEHISGLIDNGSELVSNIYDGLTGGEESLIDWFGSLATNAVEWVGSIPETLAQKGQEFVDAISEGLGEKAGELETFFSDLPGNAGTWLGDVATELSAKGEEFITGLLSGVNGEQATELGNFFTGLPGELAGKIGDVAETLKDKGREFLGGFLTGSTEATDGDIAEAMAALPGTLRDKITDVAEALKEKGREFLAGFLLGTTEVTDGELMEAITGLPAKLAGFIGDTASTLVLKGTEFLTGFYVGVSDLLNGDLRTDMGNFLTTVGGFIGSAAGSLIQTGIDFVAGFFSGAGDETGGNGQSLFSSFLDTVKSYITTVGDVTTFLLGLGTDFIAGFLDGVSGGKWTEIKDWFAKLPENAKTKIGDVAATLKQKGADFIAGLKKGIDEKFEAVSGFFTGIGETVKSFIDDPGGFLLGIGEDIINGLIEGIESIDVRAAIVGVLGGMGEAVCDLLGIHSPSTVYEGYGEYIDEGLQNGIDSGEDGILGAMLGIANGLPEQLGDAYWSMYDSGRAVMEGLNNGISYTYNGKVVPTLGGAASGISRNFGAGYYTLWSAGSNIMYGLGDSIYSTFYSYVASKLRAITAAIPALKGPIDVDRKLLTESGVAIMESLNDGFDIGMKGVRSNLRDITKQIPTSFEVGGTWRNTTPQTPSVTVTGNTFNVREDRDIERIAEAIGQYVSRKNGGRL